MLELLREYKNVATYTGFDISSEMLERGRQLFGESDKIKWTTTLGDEKFDFTIASGIFNVRLGHGDIDWLDYVRQTLFEINEKSLGGFSFNMLTKYSDKAFMKSNLYYADPAHLMDFCKTNFSKYVSVLHDYPLYEFTIIVRKNL